MNFPPSFYSKDPSPAPSENFCNKDQQFIQKVYELELNGNAYSISIRAANEMPGSKDGRGIKAGDSLSACVRLIFHALSCPTNLYSETRIM